MPEITQLQDNLKVQARVYSALLQLSELKQEALVKNDLHSLEAVTIREEQLLFEVARLEKERITWAESYARQVGRSPEEITLSALVEGYPQLSQVQQELETAVTRLQDTHELNTQLLQQAMKVVDMTLRAITNQPSTTVYQRPGHKENERPKGLNFLDKSV